MKKPDNLKTFLQMLHNFINILGFENVQEEVWFIGNIFNDKRGITREISDYISDKFIPLLNEMNSKLMNITMKTQLSKS